MKYSNALDYMNLFRWEDCVTLSVMMLDMPVGKLFVEHFFDTDKAMTKVSTFFSKVR